MRSRDGDGDVDVDVDGDEIGVRGEDSADCGGAVVGRMCGDEA